MATVNGNLESERQAIMMSSDAIHCAISISVQRYLVFRDDEWLMRLFSAVSADLTIATMTVRP